MCLEPTEPYSFEAIKTLLDMNVPVWLAHPADVKNSIGMTRGKSHQVDALRVAQYAMRFRNKMQLLDGSFLRLQELKDLLAMRDDFVRGRTRYRVQQGDRLGAMEKRAKSCFKRGRHKMITLLDRSILEVEKQIKDLLASDTQLSALRHLAISVTGTGPVLSATLLVVTRGFTRFYGPHQLNSYAGSAPYSNSSGTGIRWRTGVSPKANKPLKALFHMAAINAVRVPGDVQDYCLRKLVQGKLKMSVLNAVRSKVVHHLSAVIKSGLPYKPFKADLQMPWK